MAISDSDTIVVSGLKNTAWINSAATTNATLVYAGSCRLYGGTLHNKSATANWLKLYDVAVAPTVGTTVPKMAIPMAVGAKVDLGGILEGLVFQNGLAYAITGAAADTDTTAVGAGDLRGALIWK